MDNADDIIEQLLVLAGSVMEEASAVAILKEDRPQCERIAIVRQAGADITALAAAIEVVGRL